MEIPFDDSSSRLKFLGLAYSEVVSIAHQAQFHGFGLVAAVAIARVESIGLNPSAVGDFDICGVTGPASFGLWQINTSSCAHSEYAPYRQNLLSSPLCCAQGAWSIFSQQTSFHPWSTWLQFYSGTTTPIPGTDGNGVYQNYIGAARAAVSPSVDPTVITGTNNNNERVKATASVKVRSGPVSGSPPGGGKVIGAEVAGSPVASGSNGTVIDGAPDNTYLAYASDSNRFYIWWKVQWDNGTIGWSAEEFLQRGDSQPGDPAITSASPTSIGINQGDTFTITYTINAPSPRTVILGASLFPAGQTSGRIDDSPHDQIATLSIGQNTVQRQFAVPSNTFPGTYDLVVALWNDVNGNGIIDPNVDQEITRKTNSNAVTVMSGGSSCSYTLSPTELDLASAGGASSGFGVFTSSSCSWTAVPNQNWILITNNGSGSGNA